MIEIRSFLDLAGYYRRFVKDFSKIGTPLNKLTRKRKKLQWTPECQRSFEKLKNRLTCAPILALPRTGEDFMVYCDSSRIGFGVRVHTTRSGYRLRVMQLKDYEKNYSTHDLKLASVVFVFML